MKTFKAMSSTVVAVTALLLVFSASSSRQAEAGPFSRFGKAARQQRKDRATADKTLDRLSSGKLGKPLAKLRKGARRAQAGWWAVKTSPVTTAVAMGGTGVAATDSVDPKVRAGAGGAALLTLGVKHLINRSAKRRMKAAANAETARKLVEDPEYKGHLSPDDQRTLQRGYGIKPAHAPSP
jgi:hypothetical protein